MLLAAVVAFSALSLATALAQDLRQFVILQFLARIALVTQLTIAYVLLSESMPATRRGRVNGMLAAFASVGAALPALLLAPLVSAGHDWRGLFVLGGLPLLVLPLLWRWVGESPAFLLGRQQGRVSQSLARQLGRLLAPDLRRRFLSVSGLWFVINFWVGATMFLFSFYAVRERGWTADDLQRVAPFGLICAFVGYVAAGRLMDAIGRRPAAAVLLVLGGIATLVTFKAESFVVVAAGWVCLQALQGIWPVAYTLTTELFPTEVRASANGLAHNLLGRWGQVRRPVCGQPRRARARHDRSCGRRARLREPARAAVAALGSAGNAADGVERARSTDPFAMSFALSFARIADCSIAQGLRRRFDTIDGEPRQGRPLGRLDWMRPRADGDESRGQSHSTPLTCRCGGRGLTGSVERRSQQVPRVTLHECVAPCVQRPRAVLSFVAIAGGEHATVLAQRSRFKFARRTVQQPLVDHARTDARAVHELRLVVAQHLAFGRREPGTDTAGRLCVVVPELRDGIETAARP